jgi:hypothetical protein
MTVQATFSLEDEDDEDEAADEALTLSLDFLSAFSALPALSALSVEADPESLVPDSLALTAVADELPSRLSVR